jgi:hypothetical protein
MESSCYGVCAILGKALATGDFDGDGRADLAVGAPFYTGGRGNAQRGAVFVVSNVGASAEGQDNMAAKAPLVEEIEAVASQRLVGPELFGRFGTHPACT